MYFARMEAYFLRISARISLFADSTDSSVTTASAELESGIGPGRNCQRPAALSAASDSVFEISVYL